MGMPWLRVDTDIFDHPKFVILIQNKKWHLIVAHFQAMTWTGKHMQDGHIPDYITRHLGIKRSECDELVMAGLWDVDLDGNGWWIHGWDERQPTTEAFVRRSRAGRENALKRWSK